jgi:ABC-type lipoprotein export system ATPase subunit
VSKIQRQSGLTLTEDEKQMLLPHFFMVVVGKPGSGKTTIVERLLTRPGGYAGKFDYTFLVSPSKNKMGLPLP